jgi:hypothetical protein
MEKGDNNGRANCFNEHSLTQIGEFIFLYKQQQPQSVPIKRLTGVQ